MALDRLTKVDGGGISTTSDYRVGIITATKFVGPIEGDVTGSITATDGTFSGNVTIGGTLTYEDVTNIDSIGIITARDSIKVGSGVTIFSNGRADFTGFTTFSAGAKIPFDKTLIIGPSSLYGSIKYPNGFSGLQFDALNQMRFRCWDGNSTEPWLYANGVGGYVDIMGTNMGNPKAPLLRVQGKTTQQIKMFSSDGSNLTERFILSQSGFNFTGLSTHTGNFDLDGDLDVDGHTNLDNVSISGVTTITGALFANGFGTNGGEIGLTGTIPRINFTDSNANSDFRIKVDGGSFQIEDITNSSADRFTINSSGNVSINKDLDVDGHTNLDNVSIAGVTSVASLSSGRVVLVGAGGKLEDTANLTFSGSTLTATGGFYVNSAQNASLTSNQLIFDRGGYSYIDQSNDSGSLVFRVTSANTIALRLDSSAQAHFGADLYIPNNIVHVGDTDTKIRFPGNNAISFETDGGERLRISTGGKIGVNQSATISNETIFIQEPSGASVAGVTLAHLSGGNRYGARLQTVNGPNRGIILSTLFNSTYEQAFRIDNNRSFYFYNYAAAWNRIIRDNASYYTGIAIQESNATQRMQFGVAGQSNDIVSGSAQHDVVLKAYNANLILATNATERLRIDSSGNVDITTGQLTISNDIKSSDDDFYVYSYKGGSDGQVRSGIQYDGNSQRLRFFTGTNERLRIDSSGNVMIGRTSASKKFSVRDTTTSSGVHYLAQIGGNSHLSGYAVGIALDPEGYTARTKIGIVAEGTSTGYSRGKLHFLLDNANDSGEATLSEARMTINDSGQVTMPNQPSFMANFGGNNNTSHNNGDYLKANNTDHNTGNCYNTSNYRFTAPVAGNYLFYGRANMSGVGSGDYSRSYQVRLFKNGSSQQFHMSRTTLTGYSGSYPDTSTMVCSINLAANDYVQLKVNWETDGTLGTTENLHHHGSLFGGYLIG